LAEAREIVNGWEKAAKLARNRELTQAASVKLLSSMMEATIGSALVVESIFSFFKSWLASRATMGRASSTSKRYEGVIHGFLAQLGAERSKGSISSLTVSEIEDWRDCELKAGKGGTTVDLGVKIVRAALESARRKGLVLTNVADAVEKVASPGEERDPFTDVEIRSLLASANKEWKGMILFGAHVGLRIGDAANLSWTQLDLSAGTLSLLRQKSARVAPRPTLEPLHTDIVEYLIELPSPTDPNAPLFPSLFGKAAGSHAGLSNEFSRLMAKAGIDVTLGQEKKGKGRRVRNKGFHSLRHSMVSRIAQTEGIPDAVRKSLSGHSTESAHKRYVHLGLDVKKTAASKVRSLLTRPGKKVAE